MSRLQLVEEVRASSLPLNLKRELVAALRDGGAHLVRELVSLRVVISKMESLIDQLEAEAKVAKAEALEEAASHILHEHIAGALLAHAAEYRKAAL